MKKNGQYLLAAIAAATVGIAPIAHADSHGGGCEPEIMSSSVKGSPPALTSVSGFCLDLVDVVTPTTPPVTKSPKVEAWVDGAFVALTLGAGPNSYTKNATTNVLETLAICSASDSGVGMTTLRITKPYLTSSGKVKWESEESRVAVAFAGGC